VYKNIYVFFPDGASWISWEYKFHIPRKDNPSKQLTFVFQEFCRGYITIRITKPIMGSANSILRGTKIRGVFHAVGTNRTGKSEKSKLLGKRYKGNVEKKIRQNVARDIFTPKVRGSYLMMAAGRNM
jgi:hypothetical protein